MSVYEKGSEWRQWDLHVHTPLSLVQHYGGDTVDAWEAFIKDLEGLPKDFKVIGINDYIFLDGYKKVIEYKKNGRLQNIDLILPVVELRIDKFGSIGDEAWKKLNFHVVFSNEVTVTQIEQQFLNAIFHSHQLSPEYSEFDFSGVITKESLADFGEKIKSSSSVPITGSGLIVGFNNITYGYTKVLEALESTYFRDKYITAVGKTEWDALRWNGSISDKKTIINNADLVFISTESAGSFDVAKQKLVEQKVNHLLLDCSDSHSLSSKQDSNGEFIKDRVGNCLTWIKADPTFEGLKQIIYEPEERVYIGEKPPILSKVENNKTNYLKSLDIYQTNAMHSGDTWFNNISIEFNKELVAIIGNKGSGKSGVADILGLVGDTHTDKGYFSFLNKNKFLKGKLADKFHAQITWESGGKSGEVLLSAAPRTEKPESVRFIPQNYFEELTNEIEISKFQHVLENIIFEYIPDDEKLEKSSFEELERYKAESVNRDIQALRNGIQNINNEIVELEKKKHPGYLEKIKGFISKIEIDIIEQKKLLEALPELANPNEGEGGSKEGNDSVAKKNIELDTLKETLKEKEIEKLSITSRLESIKQFKRKVEQKKETLDEFLKNNIGEAKEYDLDIKKILKVETDYSSLDSLISSTGAKLNDLNIYFETFESIESRGAQSNNESIVYKIKVVADLLKIETDKLTGEERIFQKNVQRKKEITEIIEALTGDVDNPAIETLNFYLKEKVFIQDALTAQLKIMRNNRVEKSLEIFKKKNEIIELYNSFKKSVDNKITENKELLDDYDIKIDSSFNMGGGFYREFLGYIDKIKSGCFRGVVDGENKIKSIVEDSGFSNTNNIKTLLESIIDSLEEDNAVISEQVNKERVNSFYDYVFSLDYIKPKYELKLGGKVLSQLSPGERGALLLIFYLMIDKENIPLVIDQPEDNLDNESVYNMLSKFIKQAKKKRQIIMVTHNPNLAVGADAEQIIYVNIDKMNKNEFSFSSGSIENPEINKKIVRVLEGTRPAFDQRKLKYQRK